MIMQRFLSTRILLLAFLSWLIPFALSFAFFGPGGVLWIPFSLFKSLMVVAGGAAGLWLMLRALRGWPPAAHAGLSIGLLFLAFNLVLDIAVLLPMTGMGLVNWFYDIGLRYMLLPVMGWALDRAGDMARN
jgi:hypothetical protein